MLYSNKPLKSEAREMSFGTIYQVSVGEKGRGRQLLALTCPEGTIVEQGENPDLTIGYTKSGKPRIFSCKSEQRDPFLLLSSEGSYTRRGNGRIYCLSGHESEFDVLTRGNGADGEAGRIGSWDALLIKAHQNGLISVQPGGKGYGIKPTMILIRGGKILTCQSDDFADMCDTFGIDMPCTVFDDGWLHIPEWSIL